MVAVWVILCLIFPPIIPFVIVGALVSIAMSKKTVPCSPDGTPYKKKTEWGAVGVILALITIAMLCVVFYPT